MGAKTAPLEARNALDVSPLPRTRINPPRVFERLFSRIVSYRGSYNGSHVRHVAASTG